MLPSHLSKNIIKQQKAAGLIRVVGIENVWWPFLLPAGSEVNLLIHVWIVSVSLTFFFVWSSDNKPYPANVASSAWWLSLALDIMATEEGPDTRAWFNLWPDTFILHFLLSLLSNRSQAKSLFWKPLAVWWLHSWVHPSVEAAALWFSNSPPLNTPLQDVYVLTGQACYKAPWQYSGIVFIQV